jgi:hypothetical protein
MPKSLNDPGTWDLGLVADRMGLSSFFVVQTILSSHFPFLSGPLSDPIRPVF